MISRLAISMFATLSGLLLFVADHPIHWWPIHFVALVPLFIGIRFATKLRFRIGYALCFSLSYCLPLVYFAGTATPVVVATVVGILHWLVAIPLIAQITSVKSNWNAVLVASSLCVLELLVWHVFPIFGTAQCFARVTSAAPMLVQFAGYTGMIGVVFVLVSAQVWIADLLVSLHTDFSSSREIQMDEVSADIVSDDLSFAQQNSWIIPAISLAALLVTVSLLNSFRWNRTLGPSIQASAVSWFGEPQISVRDLCAKAKQTRASVLVTPETGFILSKANPDQDRTAIAREIANSQLFAAIGAFRQDTRTNQSLLILPDGSVAASYEKSHLIPWMETYNPGQGEIVQTMWNEVAFGTMICQDDNFSDLARLHSLRGTQVMLLPSNDWEPIRGYHLENSRMRAIECGYSIVRSVTGGISAIISPRGEMLSSVDHTLEVGLNAASGEVHAGDGRPTVYARYGDWLVGLPSLFLFLVSLLSRGTSVLHREKTSNAVGS